MKSRFPYIKKLNNLHRLLAEGLRPRLFFCYPFRPTWLKLTAEFSAAKLTAEFSAAKYKGIGVQYRPTGTGNSETRHSKTGQHDTSLPPRSNLVTSVEPTPSARGVTKYDTLNGEHKGNQHTKVASGQNDAMPEYI